MFLMMVAARRDELVPAIHSWHMGQVFVMQAWHVTWPFGQTGTGIWVGRGRGPGKRRNSS